MQLSMKSGKSAQGSGGTSEGTEALSNNLWIGNLPSDVTQSELMGLFARFGPLDCVIPYSTRSYGFVFFRCIEDAGAAKNALQGTVLRGIPLKIEFARPAKPCQRLWVGGISPAVTKEELEAEFFHFGKIKDFKFFRDQNTALVEYFHLDDAIQAIKIMNGKHKEGDPMRVDFFRSQSSRKYLHSSVGRGDGQPSNILWIGYPSSVEIDEQMLHNAMILFGEIERIKSYPSRNYSLVQFRSMDEARRAKEGLEGRIFNDPRIMIMYLSSELAPETEYPWPRTETKHPFYHNFPGQLQQGGIIGTNALIRPYGPQGYHEPLISGPRLNDLAVHHIYHDGSSQSQMDANWPSTTPGMLNSLLARPTTRFSSFARDVLDRNQFQRDSKRSRIDGALHGVGPVMDGGGYGPYTNIQGNTHLGTESSRITTGVLSSVQPNTDHIWRGILAKGGTPICHARCLPFQERMRIQFPEVVDCSSKTELDMLTEHCANASGFELVFFLPDSEDDFASYTEFMRYLSSKNRAGVAKFVDGTPLFLVPPGDFLTKVLKVTGPKRLYGVILKFPLVPSSTPLQQLTHLQTPTTTYTDRQHMPYPQAENCLIPVKEDQVLPVDCNQFFLKESKIPPKPLYPATSAPPSYQPVHVDNASGSHAGVTWSPELIANLASLRPSPSQSGQIAVFSQVREKEQIEVSSSSQRGCGVLQGADAPDYSSQIALPYTADNVKREFENNEVQPSLFGAGEGASEMEADRNQRYQSAVQFAAALLHHVQQQH